MSQAPYQNNSPMGRSHPSPQTLSGSLTGGPPARGSLDGYSEASPDGSEPMDPRKDKRAHHTALERKRRDHIKDKFAILHLELPGLCDQEKVSRSLILTKATEYIKEMSRANEQVLTKVEELKRQNLLLHEQIRQLEQQEQEEKGGINISGNPI